jgi:hypothetical protein
MIERLRFDSKNRSATRSTAKSNSITSARLSLFGRPQLLEGEDAATYERLVSLICAAVKPVDIIDEMFIADLVSLEWDVLRLRRLRLSLIRGRGLERLKYVLNKSSTTSCTWNALRTV